MPETDAKIRPLLYVRLRLDRGGPAEWLRDLVADEKRTMNSITSGNSGVLLLRKLGWANQVLDDLDDGLLGDKPQVHLRAYRDGHAEWLRDLVRIDHRDMLTELAELRGEGRSESDPEIEDIVEELNWAVKIMRDLDQGLISLAGPDRDPR